MRYLSSVVRCIASYAFIGLLSLAVQAQTAATLQGSSEGVKEVIVGADRFERKATPPTWVESSPAIPATQSKAPVVTLLAETQFLAGSLPEVFSHRAFQANSSAALESIGNITLPFNPQYNRMELNILRITRAGQVINKLATVDVRFLQRETGLDAGAYNGEITVSMLVDDLRVGDILEIAFTQKGANPVIGDRFVDYAGWDSGGITELRRVILTHPVTRKVNARFFGDLNKSYPQPVESISGGMRKLRWEQRNVPAVEFEPSVPNTFRVARSLQMSEFQSWSEVSDWAVQLFRSDQPLPADLQQVISTLALKPSNDERVSGALQWVQNEIRYFSVSLGESSHRPTAPAVTLQRRYGDCKDKSFLLIEMLRALGVQAQPVLVNSRLSSRVSDSLPSPYVFDHVIVRAEVDGKVYFLDPTRIGQTGRLDTMGQAFEGTEVLVVQPGNSNFTRIKSENYAAISRNELSEKIVLPKFDGEATIESRHLWSGVSAEFRRIQLAVWTPEQRNKVFLETYERRYPGAKYATQPVIEDDKVNNVLSITNRYVAPKVANLDRGNWVVRYSPDNLFGMVLTPPSTNRTQPLAMEVTPRRHRYNIEVEFPPDVAVIADPMTRKVHNDAFEYTASNSFRGNRATGAIELAVLQPQIEASKVPGFAAELRRTGEVFAMLFLVGKNEIKSTGLLGLGRKTLKQTIEDRGNEHIAKLTKALESGRLTGEDLLDAQCRRAETLVEMGKATEGLKDAQEAVKANPNDAEAYSCRGNVYFGLGDFTRAITDYSKAISLGKAEGHVFYRRGHSRFYNGQLAAAAEDFAKSSLSHKKDDIDAVLYTELWRVWTQKRLGIPPDAAQVELAKTQPRGEWPRPALAMLHGLMTPDEALATLDSKKGDDKEMALAEGYFYVGQQYYASGDKAKAAEYFSKAREKGVVIYIEHQAAGIELQQMGLAGKP
ncbi:MAG: DUF3857 domain-containing protein [Burkholderiaceae bacterium]